MRKDLERQVEEQLWRRRIARASAFSDAARKVAWITFAIAVAIFGVQQLAPDLWARITAWIYYLF